MKTKKGKVRKDKETATVRRVEMRRKMTVLDMLARLEAKAAIQDAILRASGGQFGRA